MNINPENVHGPDGAAADIPAACQGYEDAIKAAGGVDLQILGVGTDGHIGFNEPGSSLASRTRIKTLIEQTRRDNARFFDSIADVPHHVLTQGLGTIMDARHVIVGRNRGPESPGCPGIRGGAGRCDLCRPPSCSFTRTPRSWWTRRRRHRCDWPTTTATPMTTSPSGRACRPAGLTALSSCPRQRLRWLP